MNTLRARVALALPPGLPVADAGPIERAEWLHPTVTIVLEAHYLRFAFLCGMRMYTALSGIRLAGGWMAVNADSARPVRGRLGDGWRAGRVHGARAVSGDGGGRVTRAGPL